VITNAERSPSDQIRAREIRYVLMMGVRAVCLVAAVVLVSAHVPLLWLWIPICLVGMLAVPWLAVILANDEAPRKRRRPAPAPGQPAEHQPAALPPADPPRVIDYED
jgi:hypothetical protein